VNRYIDNQGDDQMYLIVLVIDNPYHCGSLLKAWEAAGVPGATILESRGLSRSLKGIRDDLPLLPNLNDVMHKEEHRHRTVFSVVRDREVVERVKKVSQDIIGPFDQEHTGFFFVVPVSEALGMRTS
jgi:hypothetical protein